MHTHAMLHTAPAGRHFAQLHKDPNDLADSVAEYVAAGLKRGERVILVVVPDHADLIMSRLTANDWRPDAFVSSGQLTMLDAMAMLNRFMKNGMPDWQAFRRTLGAVLREKSAAVTGGTRAYGEMVNVLWHQGQTDAAIRLEEYWNRLAQEHSFALLCCYTMDGLGEGTYAGPLHEIGRTHTDILSTPDDERFKVAVDRASNEILGNTLSLTLSLSGREDMTGEHRLPAGQRSILWLKRNMPNLYTRVLDRARAHYEGMTAQMT